MPTNKNAMTRIRVLDDLLSNQNHYYTIDDLTNEVNKKLAEQNLDGVCKRMIEKDLNYIDSVYADLERLPFVRQNSKGTGNVPVKAIRYADPTFAIFKKQLTADEKHLLKEALGLLGRFDGLPDLDGLERLRKSLGVVDQQKVISFSHNPLEETNHIGELFTAIAHKTSVHISYHRFGEEPGSTRLTLSPYLLKEYNRRWFLIAHAAQEDKLLTFGLERIDSVELLSSIPFKEYDGDIEERFEDIIGVTNIETNPVLHIECWVSSFSADYVSTKPLHESLRWHKGARLEEIRSKYPSLEGGAFFSIDCKMNYELTRELASFGGNMIVLSPDEVKESVRQWFEQGAQAYKTLDKQA